MAKVQPTNQDIQDFVDQKAKGKLENKKWYEFYNLEEPGLAVKFAYGTTRNPQRYNFWHGHKYEVTEEVAQHVEKSQTPIWEWRPDGKGSMAKQLIGWKPRYQMREVRG